MKVGDKVKLLSYKHDGKNHTISYDTYVLDMKGDCIICGNKNALINEGKGKVYKTTEAAILYFFKDSWFNVICQFKEQGVFYYCNIASPILIDRNTLKYIDYDLDLRVFPNGTYKVLDKNEYLHHKQIMNYPDEIDKIVKYELENLIKRKEENKFPFIIEDSKKYKVKLEEIIESKH